VWPSSQASPLFGARRRYERHSSEEQPALFIASLVDDVEAEQNAPPQECCPSVRADRVRMPGSASNDGVYRVKCRIEMSRASPSTIRMRPLQIRTPSPTGSAKRARTRFRPVQVDSRKSLGNSSS